MDYDSVPFDVSAPETHRVADLRPAYRTLTHRGLQIMYERISTEEAYSSNRDGHFAWDVSLLIRAACLFWRITGDTIHLVQASEWAQHMLDRSDDVLGREDWRSRLSPVWSAGPRYTAGTALVGCLGGAPVTLQAASDHLIVERPSNDTAVIRSVRENGATWSSPEGSLIPGARNYLPDLLARQSSVHAVLLRGLPAPVDLRFISVGKKDLKSQYAPHLVHTGMIARSLIALAQTLELDGVAASRSEVGPHELFEAARRALIVHDAEIRVREGQAWYVTPEDFPGRRLGLELPHNHVVDVATSFLVLGQHFNDYGLRSLGVSLTRPWLDELEMLRARTIAHPWFYYPVRSDTFAGITRRQPIAEREVSAVARAEDSSHATARVRALADWHAIDSSLVGDQTLSEVALAFRRNFMTSKNGISTTRWLPGKPNDKPEKVRLGQSDTYSGAWCALSKWDSPMKRHMNSFAYRHPPDQVFGATVLSAAEITAMNMGVSIPIPTQNSKQK